MRLTPPLANAALQPHPCLGNPEAMEVDELARAAAAGSAQDKPTTTNQTTKATGPKLQDLIKDPQALGNQLEELEKLCLGNPELEPDQVLSKLLSGAPLTDMKGLTPDEPEYKVREDRIALLRQLVATGLAHELVGKGSEPLITITRKLEKLMGKQWDPETSPAKMVEAVKTRARGEGDGIGSIPMQPLIDLTESAMTLPLSNIGSADSNGLQDLQNLLTAAKEKRVRKDPLVLRQTVEARLKKLVELAGGLQTAGQLQAAAQCLATYTKLRDVYKQQFLPLAQQLGFKDAVDLTLQVNSHLSEIDETQWKQLSSFARGGQYSAILEKLGDKLPSVAIKPRAASKSTKRRHKRSSSGDDSDYSSESEEEEKPRVKRRSKDTNPRAIAQAVGKEVRSALSNLLRGRSFGGGGRGGGRGERGRSGRGGGRTGGKD